VRIITIARKAFDFQYFYNEITISSIYVGEIDIFPIICIERRRACNNLFLFK